MLVFQLRLPYTSDIIQLCNNSEQVKMAAKQLATRGRKSASQPFNATKAGETEQKTWR